MRFTINGKQMEKMKLKAGDRVAIVATARCVEPYMVEPAIELFKSWNLEVSLAEGLYERDNYFAGTDEHRAAEFQKAIDDETVKAIVCVCGGYGTVRMVDRLNFEAFRRDPKPIVGYSDVTVLHSHVARNCGTMTLHAIMPVNIPKDAATRHYAATDTLRSCLFDERYKISFQASNRHNRTGECRAPIVGGNLSVLYSLLGSASDIDTDGKILMIEDLDEYLYHVDRMVMALKRAGKFAHLKGLLVGAMTDMHETKMPTGFERLKERVAGVFTGVHNTKPLFGHTAEEIISSAVAEYDYPVAFNSPFGHIGDRNVALPLGAEARVNIGDNVVEIDF